MSQLRRMLLSNVGYKSAYYADVLLDFCHPETGQPENTVLWLANQGGKTTLISLLFTNIEPNKKRFVQHLQKPDHHFHQYFYPTAGVVALELQTGSTNLMGETPQLVIGQCVVVNHSGDSQRIFFGFEANENISLDDLPFKGAAADKNPANMSEFRQWLSKAEKLNSTFFSTEKQEEWKKWLTTQGVEHELLAKQIDFCRSEGGISDFASFKNEQTFLEQFFKLALDESTAKQAHTALGNANRDLKEQPNLEKKQAVLIQLVNHFQHIQPLAEQYQRHTTEIEAQEKQLHFFAEQLQLRQHWLNREITIFDEKMNLTKNQRIKKQQQLNSLENLIQQITFSIKIQKHSEASQALEQAKLQRDEITHQLALTKAVIALDESEVIQKQHAILTEQLSSASSEIAPILKKLENSGSRLITAYKDQTGKINTSLENVNYEIKTVSQQESDKSKQKQSIKIDLDDNKSLFDKAEQWFEIYATQLKKLTDDGHLISVEQQPLELIEAHDYWEKSVIQTQLEKTSISKTFEEKSLALKDKARDSSELSGSIQALTATINHIQGDYDKAVDARKTLEKNTELCKLIQMQAVNPDDLKLLEKLDQHIEKLRGVITETKQSISFLSEQKDSLEIDKLAKPDDNIELALNYLAEQGLDANYYPHYLAKQNLSSDDAKILVESDPARFYGIQVNNLSATREKLSEIDREKLGLTQPIVISQAATEITNTQENLVLPVRNDAAYNEVAAETLLQKITAELQLLEDKETIATESLETYSTVQFELSSYQNQYGETWLIKKDSEINSRKEKKVVKTQQQQTIDKAISELELIQQALSDKLENKIENLTIAQAHVNVLSNFIESYQKDKERKTTEKENAKKSIALLFNQIDEIESKLLEFLEQQKLLEERQREIKAHLEKNNEYLSKVTHKNNQPFVFESPYHLKELQAEYKANETFYNAALSERGFDELKGELKQLNGQLQNQQSIYEKVSVSLDFEQIKIKQSSLLEKGVEVSQEEINLGRQEKASIEFFGEHKKQKEETEREVKRYQQHHADITVLEMPNSLPELKTFLEKQENNKVSTNKIIEKLIKSYNLDKENEQALNLELSAVDATIKTLPNELVISSTNEEYLSLAKNINSDELSTKLTTANCTKESIVNQRKTEEEKVKRLFNNKIIPIVKNSENNQRLGVIAIDIENIAINQLLKQPKHHFITLQDALNVVESQIKINTEKLGVINSCFDYLLLEADDALHEAFKVRIPADMQHYSKMPILKSRLKSKHKLKTSFSEQQRHALYLSHVKKTVEIKSVDETGYKLAATLLLKAYESILSSEHHKQKTGLNIRIIKPDDVQIEYIPVSSMIGSGGEGLTAGLLLYLVIANIRSSMMTKGSYSAKGSFLLLDNPFSKVNKIDLIRPQTQLAKKLGIQLIFATGIEDLNAIGEFEHIIRLRKDKIDNNSNRQYVEIEGKKANEIEDTLNFDNYKIESIGFSFNLEEEREASQEASQ